MVRLIAPGAAHYYCGSFGHHVLNALRATKPSWWWAPPPPPRPSPGYDGIHSHARAFAQAYKLALGRR